MNSILNYIVICRFAWKWRTWKMEPSSSGRRRSSWTVSTWWRRCTTTTRRRRRTGTCQRTKIPSRRTSTQRWALHPSTLLSLISTGEHWFRASLPSASGLHGGDEGTAWDHRPEGKQNWSDERKLRSKVYCRTIFCKKLAKVNMFKSST